VIVADFNETAGYLETLRLAFERHRQRSFRQFAEQRGMTREDAM